LPQPAARNKETAMPDTPTVDHEVEQIKVALAQTLFEELGLDFGEALEMVDRFYGEIAISLESGESVELADHGYFSPRDGFSSTSLYGSGRY
jgi:hypothetical protein